MKPAFVVLTAALVLASACTHDREGGHGTRRSQPPTGDGPVMTEVAIAIPIAPGKTEAWQRALEDLLGPRYDEYDTSRRRYGLTSQTTFLQKTPMGDFALIHLTGPDVHASFHQMSASQDPWDVAWREMTLDLHGMDFARGEAVFPEVTLAFSMESSDSTGSTPFMFLAPLTKDGAAEIRAVAAELMGDRHDEYLAARRAIGVQREAVFLESTAMGDALVFYWLASDPQASLEKLMVSSDPLDEWLRSKANAVHPVAVDALVNTASANTLVAQYPRAR